MQTTKGDMQKSSKEIDWVAGVLSQYHTKIFKNIIFWGSTNFLLCDITVRSYHCSILTPSSWRRNSPLCPRLAPSASSPMGSSKSRFRPCRQVSPPVGRRPRAASLPPSESRERQPTQTPCGGGCRPKNANIFRLTEKIISFCFCNNEQSRVIYEHCNIECNWNWHLRNRRYEVLKILFTYIIWRRRKCPVVHST